MAVITSNYNFGLPSSSSSKLATTAYVNEAQSATTYFSHSISVHRQGDVRIQRFKLLKWYIRNLTFKDVISLDNNEVAYKFELEPDPEKEIDNIFIVFDTEQDEARALLILQ